MFEKWKAWSGRKNLLLYVVIPVVLVFIIEFATRICDEFWGGFTFMFGHPFRFLCSVLIVALTLSITLLTRRRVFWISLISLVWLILGLVDVILLNSRNFAFNPGDFLTLAEGLSVAGQYLNIVTIGLIVVLLLAALTGIGFIFVRLPKTEGKMNYGKKLIAIAVLAVVTLSCCFVVKHSATYTNDLRKDYYKYGFIYSFTTSLLDNGVAEPSEYSQETIDEIIHKEDNSNSSIQSSIDVPLQIASKTPNIIIVQLESFFDLSTVTSLNINKDPIPWFRKFQSEFAGGLLTMPSVGAGTANSEFEILTGMNLKDFGAGEYPYKTIIQKTCCESIAYNLKEYGYGTHAIHNNTAGFYSRNTAFPNLGFDDFTTIEYMNVSDAERTPKGWAKDAILTEQIALALDATPGQDFVYTISVQGHGSYPENGEYPTDFQITSDAWEESQLRAMEYYAQQTYEMDQFVHDLIDEVSKRNEESIVVFYGDHLPNFGITDEMLQGDNNIYQTPYLIWNNCGLDFTSDNLTAYQLQSKILKTLNMNSGVVNRYHQANQGLDTESYLKGLENLEYDILYGDRLVYNGTIPYNPIDMKMGLKEIKITGVEKDKEAAEEGYVIVHGENFTQYSKIFINEEYYGETEYIDENTLRIYYPELQGLDSFVVNQAHGPDSILSSTKECLYYGE